MTTTRTWRNGRALTLGVTALLAAGLTPAVAWAAPPVNPDLHRHAPAPQLGRDSHTRHGAAVPRRAAPASARSATLPGPDALRTGSFVVPLSGNATTPRTTRNPHTGKPAATLTGAWHLVGSGPIAVAAATTGTASAAATTAVTVALLSPAQRSKQGLAGVAVQVQDNQPASANRAVALRVPDSVLRNSFGADYAARVHWALRPTTASPQAAMVPAASYRDVAANATVVSVPLSSTPMTVAAVAGPSSSEGSFTAAAPKASSSWDVSAQTGGFSWSYPMGTPPPPAGPTPGLGLSYNSQSIDGETGGTNNQPDEVGDGWSLNGTGFISRTYVSCSEMDGANSVMRQSGDLCWTVDNATISLAGHSGQLVHDAGDSSGVWHLDGDNSRFEYLSSSSMCAADCWRMTTVDGTQYFFGRSVVPGGSATYSRWTVPVCGTPTSKCAASGSTLASVGPFATQAWRWNLDYVVDPFSNAEAFYYTMENNSYRQADTTVVSYIRGGYLDHIDYGMRQGSNSLSAASARVVFQQDQYGRCSEYGTRATTCTREDGAVSSGIVTETKPANTGSYPDTPWDQHCATSPCTGLISPTFFSGQMLNSITTQILSGSTYSPVDVWQLTHSFPAEGESGLKNNPVESLAAIKHTAGTGAAAITVPDTVFTYESLPNRVDTSGASLPELWKQRIQQIQTDTGAIITAVYSDPACANDPAPLTCGSALESAVVNSPQTNNRLVYPQWWTPNLGYTDPSPVQDLFNKYVVTKVYSDPVTGGAKNLREETDYIYYGNAAWRFNTTLGVDDTMRTWDVYAGFSAVEVRVGDSTTPGAQQTTDYVYYQGLDGDYNGPATTPTSSRRNANVYGTSTVADSLQLAGSVYRTITRLGANGGAGVSTTPVLSDTISTPWSSAATATSATYPYTATDHKPTNPTTYTGSFTISSWLTGAGVSARSQKLADSTTRTVTTTSTYSPTFGAKYGIATTVETVASDAPDTCTTTDYVPNVSRYLIAYPSQVLTIGLPCASTPTYPNDVVSETRTSYDSAAFGTAPTYGAPTSTQTAKTYTSNSVTSAVWMNTSATYDALGRVVSNTNAMNQTSSMTYVPSTGPVTSIINTNPLGWTSTTTYDPARGSATSVTDVNGKVSSATYDALGRVTQTWTPDHPQATNPNSPSSSFAYTLSQTTPNTVATTALTPTGGTTTSYVLFDGLTRQVQTQTPSEAFISGQHTSAGTILDDTFYDSAGQTYLTDNTYTSTANPSAAWFDTYGAGTTTVPEQISTNFDGAGRPLLVTQLVDESPVWKNTYAYNGADRVDMVPPAGGTPTTTYTNSAGKITKLIKYLSADLTGTPETTSYSYDARGDMTSMTNPAGSAWSWTFDAAGRNTSATDPDAGTSTHTYNDDGTTATATDGTGTTLTYSYDPLGRKTSEATGGTTLASWTYDPTLSGTLYRGQPASSTRTVAGSGPGAGTYTSTITGYDAAYRPTGTALSLPAAVAAQFGLPTTGASYASSATYTVNGAPATTTSPAAGGLKAETVQYGYTPMGDPATISSAAPYGSVYLGDVRYTAYNKPAQLIMTNGTTEVDRTMLYSEGVQRLNQTMYSTSAHTGYLPGTDTYTYTDSGLLTSDTRTADGQPTDTQCYQYDHQQNLTEAWTPNSNNCSAAPTTAGLGGPAPYWNSYRIDPASGNRTSSISHAATTTGSDTLATYTYPAANAVPVAGSHGGPNAVSKVTTATAPAGTDPITGLWTTTKTAAYTYTGAGATTKTGAVTASYDSEGHTATTTSAGTTQTDIYDPNGGLLLQTDSVHGATLFLGETELHATPDGSAVTGTRTYSAFGTPIAERDSNSTGVNTVYWLCPTPNNTAVLELNAQTLAPKRRYIDPFGNARGANPAWSASHTYLNSPDNPLSVTVHLGARDYDPTTGRFTTVDPVLDPASPQQTNGYSYANNTPTTESDPSGLCPGGHDDFCNAGKGTTGSGFKTISTGNGNDPGCQSATSCEYDGYPGTRGRHITDCATSANQAKCWLNGPVNPTPSHNPILLDPDSQDVVTCSSGQVVFQSGCWSPQAVRDYKCSESALCVMSLAAAIAGLAACLFPGGCSFELVGDGAAAVAVDVTEAVAGADDLTVLGKYPEYLELAKSIGARVYSIPQKVFESMTEDEQWAANQKFLDRAISRGSNFVLATPADAARPGTWYARELSYLKSQGYTVGSDGMSMVAPTSG